MPRIPMANKVTPLKNDKAINIVGIPDEVKSKNFITIA